MNVVRTMLGRWVIGTLLLLPIVGFVADSKAADVRESTSLSFVPDNVAFYSLSLRMQEQYQALVGSKAFATLRQLPAVQMGVGFASLMWNNPTDERIAQVKAALDQPENQELAAMLLDAVSHEVFAYGGDGYGDAVRLLNDFNRIQREAQLQALGQGREPNEILAEKLIERLVVVLDGAAIPPAVLGFRVSDAQRANKQLDRLEALLKQVLGNEAPELAGRLTRETVANARFLTMRLDGSLIPWEQLYAEFSDHQEQLQQLAGKVKPMTVNVSLGVWKDYLILSVADSNKHLAALGQGPKLKDRKELQPLSEHLDRRIASLTYVSQDFLRKANGAREQFDELPAAARQLVPFAQLDEPVEKELLADVDRLVEQLKSYVQEPGAAFAVAFLTDRGVEGYSYNWTPNPSLDASKPLTILNHLGGAPILAFAGRTKPDPEAFEFLSQVLRRAAYYAGQAAVQQLGTEERELFVKLRGELGPLFKQLEQVTRETLLPALSDGQVAVVVDADTKSRQWHQALPAAENDLPILELTTLLGVSDAEGVRKAAAQYFSILQQMLDRLHAARPDDIPAVKMAEPQTREFEGTTVYYYPLPETFGVDRQIAPCMGLSRDFVAFSLVPRHLQRVFQATPLNVEGPIGDLSRPLAAVAYFNMSKLVDAIQPWVAYGFQVAGEQEQNQTLVMVQPQVDAVLNVLKSFREVTSVTYPQADAWITHYEMHLVDLE